MLRIRNKLLYIFSLVICQASAQQQPGSFVDFRAGVGQLIPIYNPMPSSSAVSTLECSIFKKNVAGPNWRMVYSKSKLGWSGQVMNLGNHRVLGQSIAIMPCADRRYRVNNNNEIQTRISIGLGFFNKHYDPEKNRTNNTIGSALANVSRFQIEWLRQKRSDWRIGIGLHYIHCSNAHTSVPNVGANVFGAHISLLKNKIPPKDKMSVILLLIGYTKRWNVHLSAGYGIHEFEGTSRPTQGPLYKDPVATIQLGRVHRYRSTLFTGIQWTQYNSYKPYLLANELSSGRDLQKNVQNLTWFIGYDWFTPHVAFFIQGGIHLTHPSMGLTQSLRASKSKGWIYQNTASKLGYRFYLFNMMKSHLISPYFQMAVKTNGGTADFLETTLGVIVDW
jgi:Lipid A 3-O-deacylase (PagL)